MSTQTEFGKPLTRWYTFPQTTCRQREKNVTQGTKSCDPSTGRRGTELTRQVLRDQKFGAPENCTCHPLSCAKMYHVWMSVKSHEIYVRDNCAWPLCTCFRAKNLYQKLNMILDRNWSRVELKKFIVSEIFFDSVAVFSNFCLWLDQVQTITWHTQPKIWWHLKSQLFGFWSIDDKFFALTLPKTWHFNPFCGPTIHVHVWISQLFGHTDLIFTTWSECFLKLSNFSPHDRFNNYYLLPHHWSLIVSELGTKQLMYYLIVFDQTPP